LSLPATIGRGRENLITLPHSLVSRQHCEIFAGDNGAVMVRDLDSLHGTYVGSQRIEGDHELQPGDLLTIGIVTFRAMLSGGVESETDPPSDSILDDESVLSQESDTRLATGDWEAETVRDPALIRKTPK